MTLVSSFDFDLPSDLIAQEPHARGTSRLLVVDRHAGEWKEASVQALPSLLVPGDLVVANDTRVFPARLLGRRDPSGGAVECLLLEAAGPPGPEGSQRKEEWWALVHPGQKLKPGTHLIFDDPVRAPGIGLVAEILEQRFFGRRRLALESIGASGVADAIDALGHVPLPPYIHRPDRADDRERYQTVYAREPGAVAAPTAGLHFDDALVARLAAAGIGWATVTLHVGYGTFKPVRVEQVEAHSVDPETYAVPAEAAAAITRALRQRRRIIAVGTTTARALESLPLDADGGVSPVAGEARLFIYPGHRFQIVSGLITNFHLPRSSLLMLVAALAGVEQTLAAYREAVRQGYRFYSYGDAMLVV
jgi:S-adenosylmethionine:tRNA ribosyltransferase-isomerase